MSEPRQRTERHVGFVAEAASGDVVLMRFVHPAVRYAVVRGAIAANDGEALQIVLLPPAESQQGFAEAMRDADAGSPVYVKYRGVELWWRPGRAVLLCEPEMTESLVAAVVEFAYYERELRRVESEIAAGWPEIERDKALAFAVTNADLKHSAALGERMAKTFQRRINFARVEPHLYTPDAKLAAPAQKLGGELREQADVEARAEIVDGQLEVFEHIYEMASQRMGEHRAASEGHFIEWIIIWILAAEAILMLLQVVWRVRA